MRELHRTINLMSYMTEILIRSIMMRVRNKIKPEIAVKKFGFVGKKGAPFLL